jgi:NADP-dependent 3-hydroxy acid dehydrogenase YdfG
VTHYDDVFTVFKAFQQEFGTIDRIIVNAGVGDGRRIGKGHFDVNRATAETILFRHWRSVKQLKSLERKIKGIWW